MNTNNTTANMTVNPRLEPNAVTITRWTFFSVYIIVGTVVNVWMLAAIATSPRLRSRMRNILILSQNALHLAEATLTLPAYLGLWVAWYDGARYDCYVISVIYNILLMEDFASSWVVVTILAFFLAHVLEYDPTRTFSSLVVKAFKIGVVVLPWVSAIILVPVIMAAHMHQHMMDCLLPTWDSLVVQNSVDGLLPMVAALVLIVQAVKYRRERASDGYSLEDELTGRCRTIDTTAAYIMSTGLLVVCELPRCLFIITVKTVSRGNMYMFFVVADIITNSRVLLLPLPWLLLPDIRERIRTWRPWRCHVPDGDVITVNYNHSSAEEL